MSVLNFSPKKKHLTAKKVRWVETFIFRQSVRRVKYWYARLYHHLWQTCARCKTKQKCRKFFTIQRFPKYFVIHLKRFSQERFRAKLSTLVEYPVDKLDLSSFASESYTGLHPIYNLYAVACHSGSTHCGHYTAFCKHPVSKKWSEYNDARYDDRRTIWNCVEFLAKDTFWSVDSFQGFSRKWRGCGHFGSLRSVLPTDQLKRCIVLLLLTVSQLWKCDLDSLQILKVILD